MLDGCQLWIFVFHAMIIAINTWTIQHLYLKCCMPVYFVNHNFYWHYFDLLCVIHNTDASFEEEYIWSQSHRSRHEQSINSLIKIKSIIITFAVLLYSADIINACTISNLFIGKPIFKMTTKIIYCHIHKLFNNCRCRISY